VTPSEELLDLLDRAVKSGESVAVSFQRIAKALETIAARRPASGPAPSAANGAARPGGSSSGQAMASSADLDSERGDPAIKFNPRRWEGPSYVGFTYSQTCAEFLDLVAESLEWSADNPKAGKEKYAAYDRKDAARARGWAHRFRNGFQPRPPPPPAPEESAEEFDPPC